MLERRISHNIRSLENTTCQHKVRKHCNETRDATNKEYNNHTLVVPERIWRESGRRERRINGRLATRGLVDTLVCKCMDIIAVTLSLLLRRKAMIDAAELTTTQTQMR